MLEAKNVFSNHGNEMKSTLGSLCKQNASQLLLQGKHEPRRKFKTIELAKLISNNNTAYAIACSLEGARPQENKERKERKQSIKDNKCLTIEVYSRSKHPEVQVFVSKHTIASRKFHPINNKIGEPTSIRANHRPKRGGMPQRDNKRR